MDSIADPAHYAVEGILRDGGSIYVRAIRADDKQRLLDHFHRLSARSVYLRFFGVRRQLSEAELVRFTEPDFVRHVALVATLGEGAEERIIGVGRYFRHDEEGAPERAEVAFAVLDEHQGRGVGTLLLEHLGRIARAAGVVEFEADVLGENNQMLEMLRSSGFQVKRSLEAGVVHVRFPTEETEQARQVSLARELHAAAESVRVILHPRSVAVVGASREEGSIGATLLANLRRFGFKGRVFAVNPRAEEIQGVRCHPSVGAIGEPVDLALIAVPARVVPKVVEECVAAGTRGLVVISAGFAEVSEEGRRVERELRELVRRSGMRMVGPNCMGVLNADPEISLNATFAPTFPPFGNVGMLSQSGALGIAMLDYARNLNIGISTFVSVGNKADVSGNDLLAYWSEDPRTEVIVLYLESFGNPRRFARIAPAVAMRKPIVAVKSGRSAAGTRAASSHSAALASLDVAVDALFEQAGVIRTNTLEELFEVTALLSTQPLPAGRRVGVITNAGGPGILLADACEAHGLELPELLPETKQRLSSFLPAEAGLGNPVDLIASATTEQYLRAVECVAADPGVDAVVIVYIPIDSARRDEYAAAIAQAASAVPREKPVLTVFLSSKGAPPHLATGPRGALPAYAFPEDAARALAAAERYSRWRRRPRGSVVTLDRFTHGVIRAVVERVLAGAQEPRWLASEDIATLLRAVGIAMAVTEEVKPEEARARAERMGFPLVAKAVAADLLHRSDVGGVVLGLEDGDAVERAVRTLAGRMQAIGKKLEGVLLQREVRGGVEALVGVTTDPTFGPLVVCGLGGILVELLRDVSFRLTPVSDVDAAEMLAKLRAARLLDGYRGAPAADREALIGVITRISALVEALPELRELDLNPVKVLPPGQGAIVVDARVRIGPLAPRGA